MPMVLAYAGVSMAECSLCAARQLICLHSVSQHHVRSQLPLLIRRLLHLLAHAGLPKNKYSIPLRDDMNGKQFAGRKPIAGIAAATVSGIILGTVQKGRLAAALQIRSANLDYA